MKLVKLLLPLCLLLLLQGCLDGEAGKAKKLSLGKDLTFAQYLDDSKNCVKAAWSSYKDEKGNTLIKAVCTLDPAQVTLDKKAADYKKGILADEGNAKRQLMRDEELLQRAVADKTRYQEGLRRIHGSSFSDSAVESDLEQTKQKLASLVAGKEALLKRIEAKKEADLRAVDVAFKPDQDLAAEYLFYVTGDTARFLQLELHVGEQKVFIAPFDASRFLAYAAQGHATMKSPFWQEARARVFKPDLSLPLSP